MYKGKYIFAQLCDFLPKRVFDCLVDKYEGNKYVKSFTCWNHLLVLIFGQLSNRESLRDLITTLSAHKEKFHHLGFGKSVTRSNLSKANEIRSVEIFEDFSHRIIELARSKRADLSDFFIENNVYAFDSSTITFCMKTFWWAKTRRGKAGVKLHTLYDIKAQMPSFNIITDQLVSDCTMMDEIPYESGSFYIFDKAYVSTPQLYNIHLIGSYFVVRKKDNMKYRVWKDKNYNNPQTGIMADQIIEFTSRTAQKGYPIRLRYVVFYSKKIKQTLCFFSNNFDVSAEDISQLYKHRWDIETFFKWMKQHLRIKEFYGTSENSVKIQIHAAIISYCLVAIVEKELELGLTPYEVLRILSISLFEKMPLHELFKDRKHTISYQNDTQLKLNFF